MVFTGKDGEKEAKARELKKMSRNFRIQVANLIESMFVLSRCSSSDGSKNKEHFWTYLIGYINYQGKGRILCMQLNDDFVDTTDKLTLLSGDLVDRITNVPMTALSLKCGAAAAVLTSSELKKNTLTVAWSVITNWMNWSQFHEEIIDSPFLSAENVYVSLVGGEFLDNDTV